MKNFFISTQVWHIKAYSKEVVTLTLVSYKWLLRFYDAPSPALIVAFLLNTKLVGRYFFCISVIWMRKIRKNLKIWRKCRQNGTDFAVRRKVIASRFIISKALRNGLRNYVVVNRSLLWLGKEKKWRLWNKEFSVLSVSYRPRR